MEVNVKLHVRQKVTITEVTDDGIICLQLDSGDAHTLEKLSEDISTVVRATPTAAQGFRPSAGTKCFARSLADDIWYRAVVHRQEGGAYSMYYVDYGNMEDGIGCDRLFPPVTDYFQLPYQAVQCRLAFFTPNNSEWSHDCVQGLRDNVLNQTIPGMFHDKVSTASNNDRQLYFVTLYWDDTDENYTVQEELVAMGMGTYEPTDTFLPLESSAEGSPDPFNHMELNVGHQYKIYVSYADNPDVLWGQLAEKAKVDEFETFVFNLQERMESGNHTPLTRDPVEAPPPLNGPCCVQYALDQSWCRGLVQSVDVPSSTADVLFVDFGNTETIPLSEMFVLPKELLSISAQATSFSLHGIVNKGEVWSVEALLRFKELYEDKELVCDVVCLDSNGYPAVKLMDPESNYDIAQVMIAEGHGLSANETESHEEKTVTNLVTPSSSFKTIPIAIGSKLEASVTSIETLNSFHIQLFSQAEQLAIITGQVELHCSSPNLQPVSVAKAGMPVLAQFTEDQQWYRAYTTPPSETISDWGVVFVDFGNSQSVDLAKLKNIPSPLLETPVQAVHCSLEGVSLSLADNKQLLEKFRLLTLDEYIECEVVGKVAGDLTTQLFKMRVFKDGQDVAELLKQIDVVESSSPLSFGVPNLPSSQRVSVMVCFIESVCRFACQLSDNCNTLEQFQSDFSKHCLTGRGEGVVKPVIGTCCAALFSEDEQWYRAQVIKVLPNETIEVLFVDYGNTDTVSLSNTRVLVEDHYKLPCQAILCSLDGVPPKVTSELTTLFIDLCLEGTFEAEFFVSKPTIGNIVPCKLFQPDTNNLIVEDILGKLTPTTPIWQPDFPPPTQSTVPGNPPADLPSSKSNMWCDLTPDTLAPAPSTGSRSGSRSRQSSDTPLIQSLVLMIPCQIEATISHVVSPSEFYIQQLSQSTQLQTLMDDMFRFYVTQKKGFPLQSAYVGGHCSAPFSDGNYYRASITSIDGTNVGLFYIDFGNTDNVPIKNIFTLSSRFTSIPAQVISCCLSKVAVVTGTAVESNWSDECVQAMKDIMTDQEATVGVVSLVSENCYEATVTVNSRSVSEMLRKAGHVLEGGASACSRTPSRPSTRSSSSYSTPPPGGKPAVPPLTLPFNEILNVVVTEITSRLFIYCQLSSKEQEIEEIKSVVSKFASTSPKPLEHSVVKKGDYVLGRFTGDDEWYRGKVISTENGIKVGYVDYGNLEVVAATRVLEMPGILYDYPAQAVRCQLSGLENAQLVSGGKTALEERLLYAECQVTILRKESGQKYVVDMVTCDDGGNVKEWVLQSGLVTGGSGSAVAITSVPTISVQSGDKKSQSPSSESLKKNCNSGTSGCSSTHDHTPSSTRGHTPSATNSHTPLSTHNHTPSSTRGHTPSTTSLPAVKITEGDILCVYVSYCQDDIVWVQPASQIPELQSLSQSIADIYVSSYVSRNLLTKFRPGDVCCAQYTEDNDWYRARILGEKEGKVTTLFVDYGNTDVVSTERICQLKDELFNIPQLAIPCQFEATPTLPQPDSEESINIRLIHQDQSTKRWRVEVIPINAHPVPSPYHRPQTPMITVPPLPLLEDATHQVYIAHTESPDSFWCQTTNHSDRLEQLMSLMADYYTDKLPPLVIEPDTFCAAQYSENDSWYRARVVDVNKESVRVLFIDYGNTEDLPLDRIAALDPQFTSLPSQAFHCSLFPSPPGSFNERHLESFYSLDFDQLFTAVLTRQLSQGVWLVQLNNHQGQSINEIFTATTKNSEERETTPTYPTPNFDADTEIDVYVTCVNGPENFFCQPLIMASELEEMMNNIAAFMATGTKRLAIDSLNIGQSCLACYTTNEDWFRAQVEDIDIEKNTVLVYYTDYGNVSYVDPDRIAPLPRQFLSVPAQVVQCSAISSAPAQPLSTEVIEGFSRLVQEESQHTINVVSFNQSEQKYTVTIHSDGFDQTDLSQFQSQLLNSAGESLNVTHPHATPSLSIDDISTLVNLPESLPTSVGMKDSKTPSTDLEEEEGSEEGSVTTGEPLIHAPCKLSLAGGEELNVKVVYVVDPSLFYIQRVDCTSELDSLSREVNQYCCDFADNLVQDTYHTGDFVLAYYDKDSHWHRGFVDTVLPDDKLLNIHFIDFGIIATVPSHKVIMCPGNFLELPIQAIPCSLTQVPSREVWPLQYKSLIEQLVTDIELKLTVVIAGSKGMAASVSMTMQGGRVDVSQKVLDCLQEECETGGEEVTPGDLTKDTRTDDVTAEIIREEVTVENNEPLDDKPTTEAIAMPPTDDMPPVESPVPSPHKSASPLPHEDEPLSPKRSESLPPNSPSPNPRKLEHGSKYDVYLTNVTSPYKLVCQLHSDTGVLESIAAILEQVYTDNEEKFELQSPPTVGTYVCAKYDKDDLFYRAKLVQHFEDSDTYLVEFIDYGNHEMVVAKDLKELDSKLVSYAPLAIYCSLSGIPEDPNRSDHFTSTLVSEILGCIEEEGVLSMEVVSSETEVYKVILSTNTQCINDVVRETMTKLLKEHSSSVEREDCTLTVTVATPVADNVPANSSTSEENSVASCYPPPSFQPGDILPVYVIICDSLVDISCQMKDNDRLQSIAEVINKKDYTVDDGILTLGDCDYVEGKPVLACSSNDNKWKRSSIVSHDSNTNIVTVRHVDYGTDEELPIERIKHLPSSLSLLSPPLSVVCQLSCLLETDLIPEHCFNSTDVWELEWPVSAVGYFTDVIKDKEDSLSMEIISLAGDDKDAAVTVKLTLALENDEQTADVRDLVISKLREPKPLVLDNDGDHDDKLDTESPS